MTLLETFDTYILPRTARVRRLVSRWCSKGEQDEAYQVCMIELWEKLPHFSPEGGNVDAWVDTIVRHRLVALHREERKREHLQLDAIQADGHSLLDTLADPDSLPENPRAQLIEEELQEAQQLVEQLLDLPAHQREAFVMQANGRSLREIALQLRCSLSQATRWCFLARKNLRTALLDEL